MNPRTLFWIFYLSVYKMTWAEQILTSFKSYWIFFNKLFNAFDELTTILRDTRQIISKFKSFFRTRHNKNKTETRPKSTQPLNPNIGFCNFRFCDCCVFVLISVAFLQCICCILVVFWLEKLINLEMISTLFICQYI